MKIIYDSKFGYNNVGSKRKCEFYDINERK